MVTLGEVELAPEVVWIGVLPGQLCRGADQVRERVEQIRRSGRTIAPELLAERDGVLLIDPHVDPPADLNPELHQIAIVSDGVVHEMRDYPNRAAAEAAFEAVQ